MFFENLSVMDVCTKNRGRQRQKLSFPAAPMAGRNFLTSVHLGIRVRNVRRKPGPKSLCLYFTSRRLYCRTPEKWFGGEFSGKWIGFRPKKSELQAKGRNYKPKVRVTTGETPRIRNESPRKGARMAFRCFCRKPPLKPSWIHLIYIVFSPWPKASEKKNSMDFHRVSLAFPRKFPVDFPGASLTVDLKSNPEVSWRFPESSPDLTRGLMTHKSPSENQNRWENPGQKGSRLPIFWGCGFFAYSGAFWLTVDNFRFFAYNFSFFLLAVGTCV